MAKLYEKSDSINFLITKLINAIFDTENCETIELSCVDIFFYSKPIYHFNYNERNNIFSLILCQLSKEIYKNTQKRLRAKFSEISDSINFSDNKIN